MNNMKISIPNTDNARTVLEEENLPSHVIGAYLGKTLDVQEVYPGSIRLKVINQAKEYNNWFINKSAFRIVYDN